MWPDWPYQSVVPGARSAIGIVHVAWHRHLVIVLGIHDSTQAHLLAVAQTARLPGLLASPGEDRKQYRGQDGDYLTAEKVLWEEGE
jgi:hypothetical protein